jgi:hypothetical protein
VLPLAELVLEAAVELEAPLVPAVGAVADEPEPELDPDPPWVAVECPGDPEALAVPPPAFPGDELHALSNAARAIEQLLTVIIAASDLVRRDAKTVPVTDTMGPSGSKLPPRRVHCGGSPLAARIAGILRAKDGEIILSDSVEFHGSHGHVAVEDERGAPTRK